MSSSNITPGGIGVAGMLGVLFVGLKLGGIINWSWLWVTAPFWISASIGLVLIAIALTIFGVIWIIENKKK